MCLFLNDIGLFYYYLAAKTVQRALAVVVRKVGIPARPPSDKAFGSFREQMMSKCTLLYSGLETSKHTLQKKKKECYGKERTKTFLHVVPYVAPG